MVLAKIGAYSRRNETSKRNLEDLTIDIILEKLLLFLHQFFIVIHRNNYIHDWSNGKENHELDHKDLAQVTCVLHKVERFLAQVFEWLNHKFLLQVVLGRVIEHE